jgi:hypothetical protein
MMRVPAQACLVTLAALLSACSSTPIDDSDATGEPPAPGGPTQNDPDAAPGSPVYTKRDYPAGPYGTGLRATVENFAFLGWRDPVASNYDETKLERVELAEFYNPDERSDIKLLWINASAVWCSVCRSEMKDIKTNGVSAAFRAKGVQLIGTLFEDNDSGPARPIDLHNWGSAPAHSIDFPLLLDPGFKLGAFFASDATPLNMLVDARTMQVIDATMGYSSDYWQRVDEFVATLP